MPIYGTDTETLKKTVQEVGDIRAYDAVQDKRVKRLEVDLAHLRQDVDEKLSFVKTGCIIVCAAIIAALIYTILR